MRPRLDASHERMFGEKNSLFGVTAHLDKRRTESFFLQTFFHRSEEHTSELQSRSDIVCRLLLEKKNNEECGRSGQSRDQCRRDQTPIRHRDARKPKLLERLETVQAPPDGRTMARRTAPRHPASC